VSIIYKREQFGEDVNGLQELLIYGLKGTAAYADHALILGLESEPAYTFFRESMCYLAEGNLTVADLLGLCLKCGEVNLGVMELLDKAHTDTFGHPVPTPVRIEPHKGKAILVSGHDLKDLEQLLIQTQGTGINIYTHGEMLPAHGYPRLKAYPHLAIRLARFSLYWSARRLMPRSLAASVRLPEAFWRVWEMSSDSS